MKKRIFSAFIALLTFIMTIPATAFAADNVIKVTSSATEVEPGEIVILTFKLPDVESFGGSDAWLYFDNTKAKYVSNSKGSAVLPSDLYIDYTSGNDYVSVTPSITDDETYDLSKDLCTLTFEVLEGATGDLGFNLDVHEFYDYDTDDIAFTTSVAKVTVKDNHVHTLTPTAAKAATCEEAGNIAYWTCSECGKIFSDENGTKEISQNDIVVPATDHAWDNGVVTTQPTCTEAGVRTFTCANDSTHKKNQPEPATGHTLTAVAAKAATCEKEGNIAYYECSVCHKYFSDAAGSNEITDKTSVIIPATNHNWGDWTVTTPATEESEGLETHICKNDASHKETRVIPKLNHVHNLTAVAAKAATCVEAGNIAYWTCNGCGKLFSDAEGKNEINQEDTVIPATDHDWDEGEITTPATCTKEGVKTFHCKNNNDHTKTEPVDKIAHTLTKVDAKDATCKEEGNTEYYECSVCHKYFSDAEGKNEITDKTSVVVALADHTPGTPVEENRVEPTDCEVDGSYDEVVYCTVCKKELSREAKTIKAPGHDWDEGEITTPATCTEEGVKTFHCKNNNDHTKTEPVDKIAHTLTKVDAVPATCDVDGNTEYYECTVCHKYFSDAEGKNEITDKTSVIVPKAHTPGEPVEENRVEPADCVTDGSFDEVVYCTVCKKELSREAKTIKAPGHEWGEWETVKEATTTEPGSRKHSCKNCDAEETEEIPVITYSVSEQTWTKGSTDGALFTVNRSADDDKTFSLFDSAEVDGTKLTSDNYEAAAGSLKLVLKAAYLETLAEGDHTVKITFADGSAETKLVVKAKPAVDDGNSGNGNNQGNTDTGNTDTGNTDNGNTGNGNTDTGNTDNGNTGSGNTDTDKPGNGGSDGNGGSGNPDTGSAAAAMSIVTVLAAAAIVLKKKK